jgi:hypothetical protein
MGHGINLGIHESRISAMPNIDPQIALEELNEEAVLPNPVRVRDMLFHAQLKPEQSLELNRQFTEYQKHFGEALRLAKQLLASLVQG